MHIILAAASTFLSIVEKLTPFIGLALILVTFLTLREVSRQRREAYRPRLFVGRQTYFVQRNPNGTPCFLKSNGKKVHDLHARPYELELTNIGLGAAHTIRLSWKYDKAALVSEMAELGRQSGRLQSVSNGHFQYIFNLNDKEHGYRFRIARPAEIGSEIPFLKAGAVTRFILPDTIRHIITFNPYLKLLSLEFPNRIEISHEGVSLQIAYLDIAGRAHTQLFHLAAAGSALGVEDENGNYGSGTLVFQMQKERGD